jgi:hypothetical protein
MDNVNPLPENQSKRIKYPHDDMTSRIMKFIEFLDGDFLNGIPHLTLGKPDPHITANEMKSL